MLKPILIPKIIQYIKCSAQWHKMGEPMPIEDGPGLEMSDLEEEILTSFGLPGTAFRYSNIMQQHGFDDEDAEDRADLLYESLIQEAEAFLLSPAKPSTELLKEFKEDWAMAQNALPFLGFDFTVYTGFLYHDIYLAGRCSETELLQFLQFAKDYCLQEGKMIPYEFEMLIEDECYEALNKADLPYLDDFLEYLHYIDEQHAWDLDTRYLPPIIEEKVEDELILHTFYLSRIYIYDKDSVRLEVMIHQGDSFQTIGLFCEMEEMNYLLRFARYNSLVGLHQMTEQDLDIISFPYEYEVFKIEGCNHEINRCQVVAGRLMQEKENDPDPHNYYIEEIIPTENVVSETWDKLNDLPF